MVNQIGLIHVLSQEGLVAGYAYALIPKDLNKVIIENITQCQQ